MAESVGFANSAGHLKLILTYWYSPEVRRPVRMSFKVWSSYVNARHEDILELVSFKKSP